MARRCSDVPSLFDAGFLDGGSHPLRIGKPEEHPFLKRQTRLVFERCGITDPLCLQDYQAYKGFEGLRRAIEIGPAATIDDVILSGLRGRGGAGFPTGVKWRTVAETSAPQKYIVCNADEGDSGTFADRMIMEGDPYCPIEGMAIAAVATGATQGYIYIRSEYPHAVQTMAEAVIRARKEGLLGERLLGSGHSFDMEVRVGAGAYICGEETSLLESLEGRRGQVRAKPPLPAHKGLFGQPTVINNVLSLASLHFILVEGGEAYRDYGMGRSRGTKPIQLAGNIKHGGLFETAFGITLGELVDDIGGGTARAAPFALCRLAARSAPISRVRCSTRPSIMKRSRRVAGLSAMAASWCSMTPWTFGSRRGLPLSSVRLKAAENAPLAGLARCAESRRSTKSGLGSIQRQT